MKNYNYIKRAIDKQKQNSKIVIYEEKQNEMIHDKEKEIIELEKEKKLHLEKYDKKISELEKQKHKIQNIYYINKDDSFNVIAYLVSKIEGIHYSSAETEIVLYDTAFYRGSLSYPFPVNYKLAYLVSNEEQDIAKEEIKERFSIKRNDSFYLKDSDYYSISKQLKEPSSHYIQLAYYKDKDGDNIRYKYGNFIDISKSCSNINSAIYDKRYTYIIDFMNEVIYYRLSKEDFSICYDEMIELADDFVKRYKSNKSLVLTKK